MNPRIFRHLVTILAAITILTQGMPCVAQLAYTITPVGIASELVVSPNAINSSGKVAGSVGIPSQAFSEVNSAVTLTMLGNLMNGSQSLGYGMNDFGAVVGTADDVNNNLQAFINTGGAMTVIGPLTGGSTAQARAINNSGEVVGFGTVAAHSPAGVNYTHGFTYSAGTLTDIGTLTGGNNSLLFSVNNQGVGAGEADTASKFYHAITFSGGTLTDIGVLPNTNTSYGIGVNASGQVAGTASTSGTSGFHGFLYTGGTMSDLGSIPGYTSTVATGINDGGQIVGFCQNAQSLSRAFVYNFGFTLDLNGTLAPNTGWALQRANAINNAGQITGSGTFTSGNITSSLGFILTPITPKPHARFDFDGDGKADILWHNSATGQLLTWYMNGTAVKSYGSVFAQINPAWNVAAVADVDGDQTPDILWENAQTGQLLFWLMNNTSVIQYGAPFATVPDLDWHVVSLADFDGDGHPDILWQNSQTGNALVWYMIGPNIKRYGATFAFPQTPSWTIAGTADFNRDGHPDILWENTITGQLEIWYMGGADGTTVLTYGTPFATLPSTQWQVVSMGDTNGDGHPDLTIENTVTGDAEVWLMGGAIGTTILQQGAPFATISNTNWQIVGVN